MTIDELEQKLYYIGYRIDKHQKESVDFKAIATHVNKLLAEQSKTIHDECREIARKADDEVYELKQRIQQLKKQLGEGMIRYQLDCNKFHGPVEVDENSVITDVMYMFEKFKGQKLEALTYWVQKKFGFCTLRKIK